MNGNYPRTPLCVVICSLFLSLGLTSRAHAGDPIPPRFAQVAPNDFAFDTGILKGRLHPDGKSLGLTEVVHIPSGKRLDSSNGLLSHYRVFTEGVRYGGGAWDWPSSAELLPTGAVRIRWERGDRPFKMEATYQWRDARTVQVQTKVEAVRDLRRFESFLANYFSEGFTNAAVLLHQPGSIGQVTAWSPITLANGVWQMFPRDADALTLIKDGRWKLEPHPVDWVARPRFVRPVAGRWDRDNLTVAIECPAADCFAVSSPHQTEGHRSLYFSLFGRDFKAGETAVANTELTVGPKGDKGEVR